MTNLSYTVAWYIFCIYFIILQFKYNISIVCIDPLYVLKGAAKPAQEYYRPPNYKEDVIPINLLEKFKGRLWLHPECQLLLKRMLDLAIYSYNIANKTRDAIEKFRELLELDPSDNLVNHILLQRGIYYIS